MLDCLFCKIIKGEIPAEKLGETENFICFLDIRPISEGHALIVPKEHFKDFMQFPEKLAKDYIVFSQEMAKKIVKAIGADGFNIGVNNGKAAGQVIFHQHSHIIPRFHNDGLQSWPHHEVTQEQLAQVKKRIQ